ncbi:uncharacterized protein [Nicotiana tomentosiformis]|uniref:uncharacterized protein n=1 Tax=Nicotiana tomentosiformis TaxID=4098 RepID=UPI00388CE5CF
MCGKKKETKFLEDQRIIQFLMGLNDVYSQSRSNIFMMNPLPSLDLAYLPLLQDESQREIYVNPLYPADGSSFMATGQEKTNLYPTDASPFMVGTQGKAPQRSNVQPQKVWNTNQNPADNQHKFKGKKSKYNPNVSCTHCMRTGNSRADCYMLIGFPENFQFTRSGNYQGMVKANRAVAGQEDEAITNTCGEGSQVNQNQHFSREVVNIIKQVQIENAGSTEINANIVAGIILKYSGICCAAFNTKTWIIDSGASEHMCFDSNSFIDLTPLPAPVLVPLMRRGQAFGEVRDGLYLLQPTSNMSRVSNQDVVSISKGRNSNINSSSVSSLVPKFAIVVSDMIILEELGLFY